MPRETKAQLLKRLEIQQDKVQRLESNNRRLQDLCDSIAIARDRARERVKERDKALLDRYDDLCEVAESRDELRNEVQTLAERLEGLDFLADENARLHVEVNELQHVVTRQAVRMVHLEDAALQFFQMTDDDS